jgi:hypothetical protein
MTVTVNDTSAYLQMVKASEGLKRYNNKRHIYAKNAAAKAYYAPSILYRSSN